MRFTLRYNPQARYSLYDGTQRSEDRTAPYVLYRGRRFLWGSWTGNYETMEAALQAAKEMAKTELGFGKFTVNFAGDITWDREQ